MECRPHRLPSRGVGSRRRVQRARWGVAPDGGVHGGARGGEGMAAGLAGDSAVRRICSGEGTNRGVEAESSDAAVWHRCLR